MTKEQLWVQYENLRSACENASLSLGEFADLMEEIAGDAQVCADAARESEEQD
jgi:hypothetical protein